MTRALFVLSLCLAVPALAKLAPTTLDSLIKEAELIVEVTPSKIVRKPYNAGEATLTVLRVHRGTLTEKELTIAWDAEVHAQHIDSVDHDYLLFLKRNDEGKWVPAQYGRSFWPFVGTVVEPEKANLDHESRSFAWDYPLTMATLTPKQQKALVKDKQISIARLMPLFTAK